MSWSEIQKPAGQLPLYPDIEKHGSLANLLNSLFREINSPLLCEDCPLFKHAGGRIECGQCHSQLSIAAQTRAFHFDFWQQGVCLASAWCTSPQEIASLLHQLLAQGRSPLAVEAEVPWFQLNEKGRVFLDGTKAYTDNQWRRLDDLRDEPHFKQLHPLITAAHAHPRLGVLYPFVSLYSLQFSRCTGYPFDCPCSGIWASPNVANDAYQVQAWGVCEKNPEFEGTIEQVIAFVAAQLPPDCGPAHQGTAECRHGTKP